jgi:hypothetical protein
MKTVSKPHFTVFLKEVVQQNTEICPNATNTMKAGVNYGQLDETIWPQATPKEKYNPEQSNCIQND